MKFRQTRKNKHKTGDALFFQLIDSPNMVKLSRFRAKNPDDMKNENEKSFRNMFHTQTNEVFQSIFHLNFLIDIIRY